jgi:hypothetical protein
MLNLKSNNQCFEGWIKTKEPPFVRRSLERDYRQAFNHHIIPYMGKTELDDINVDTLENFRIYLVEERKLTRISLIMIQQNYGKYIRDDGDALFVPTSERPK